MTPQLDGILLEYGAEWSAFERSIISPYYMAREII
jgi:hypothetical protein